MTNEPNKARRGCLFYGCLTSGILLLVVVIAVLAALSYAKKLLNTYTDTQPMPLPTVQMSSAEMDAVRQRIDTFHQNVRQHREAQPLVLTGDDINALIATDPDLKSLKGKVYVTIETNLLKGQVSVPLTDLGLRAFRGRYLNGTATFNLSLDNSNLTVTVQSIVAKGKPLSGRFMNRLRQQNLAENANTDSRSSMALDQLQSIQVKDGKLIIMPRSGQ